MGTTKGIWALGLEREGGSLGRNIGHFRNFEQEEELYFVTTNSTDCKGVEFIQIQ